MVEYMNHDGDQFKHVWKPGKNDMDQPIEVSETPHGKYAVSGHGAGRMKWSVSLNPTEDNPDGEWNAVGRTRKEVRAEADLDVRDRKKR
jgi:hypothetical protein